MGNYRIIELETASDWGTDGTKTIDLNFLAPMTQLQLYGIFKAGTTTWANSPAANFTKIEIVDGSRVLWSATGRAAQGHHMLSTGMSPPGFQHLRNTKSVGIPITINFGLFPGDRKYAFDPTKFKNPQLKVSYDEDVHCTTSTTNSIQVQGMLFDDSPPTPTGYLRLYEVQSYGPTASTVKEISLPTDLVTRRVYFNALKSQTSLGTTMGNVKLTEDEDAKVPYNGTASNLMRQINTMSPIFEEHFRIHVATSGDTYFSAIGNILGGTTGSYDAALASGFASHMGGSFKMRVETGSNYYTADIAGYNPQGMFNLPVCDPNNDATWFDARKLGTWELKLTAGSAVSSTDTFRVYLEQLQSY